jgi:oligopeptide transport system permease protein
LMFAGQGDPVQAFAGERPVSPAQRAQLTERFHLNDSLGQRYRYFIRDLLSGDIENFTGQPVLGRLAEASLVTGRLALIAILATVVLGVTAGVIAGIRRAGMFDHTTLILALLVIGVPSIVLAPLAQYLFAIRWRIFPVIYTADQPIWSLVLPGLVLGSLSVATVMRLTRASVGENLRADYARTATAKGITRRRVIGVHVLRNSLVPIVTFLGVELGNLMGGAIITEGVFNIPGIGGQLYRAIGIEDGPTVVTIVSLLVIIYIIVNLVVDLLHAVLDPRIRHG